MRAGSDFFQSCECSLRASELRESYIVTGTGLGLFFVEAPLVIDVIFGVAAEFGRALEFIRRVEVLVEAVLWLVLSWRRWLELGSLEAVSGFGERVLLGCYHLGVDDGDTSQAWVGVVAGTGQLSLSFEFLFVVVDSLSQGVLHAVSITE
jgi:hypothetical protein